MYLLRRTIITQYIKNMNWILKSHIFLLQLEPTIDGPRSAPEARALAEAEAASFATLLAAPPAAGAGYFSPFQANSL
jgi:hypothetical protein